MTIKYPHTIENCLGEKIIFLGIESTSSGEKVNLEAFCKPGCGPAMHTHFKQNESLTVVSGVMGYQILGEEQKFAQPGETVFFPVNTPHKFWAESQENLHCTGFIEPANTVVYFLSALYAAQNKSGSHQPEAFDGAYLMVKYASEYDVIGIPAFVKKIIFPITYFIGRLLGKYSHFKDAPAPIK
ncbi:MAG: cupin domain-containing protein [Saprospiraceae bacterium]|nr:cupin domain-containing protein [Saprospiraceae bacterium]